MKKLSIMIMALALVLGMAQCKKQTEQQANEPAGATMDVTVRVQGNTEKTDITSAGVVTWKQGDKLYVVGESQGLLGYVSAMADGDPATFSGSIKALASAQTLRFYYVGDKSFTLNGDDYTFDLGSQDGSLAGIAAHNQLMWGKTTGTIAVGAIDFGTIEMTSLMSIAHLNIKDGDAAVSGPVTVTGGFASAEFDAKTYNGETLTGTAGDITMTFASPTTSTDCYLALLPGTQTLMFSADGKEATLDEKIIAANTFYNADDAVEVAVSAPTHETVNFGAPDLNWSKYNLGVDPSDLDAAADWYGWYFMWGSVTEEGDPDCNWSKCPGNGGSSSYNSVAIATWNSSYLTNNVLKSEVDAAAAAWGDGWRMPTKEEWKDLYDNNTFKWLGAGATDSETGFKAVVAGYLVVKGGKNSIASDALVYMFLPAAGNRDGTSPYGAGSVGYYWSSSLNSSDPNTAYYMNFTSGDVNPQNSRYRCIGLTVRPVR